MERNKIILARWERDLAGWLGQRSVQEGDEWLGCEIEFAEEPEGVGFWASLKDYLRLAKDG